MYNINNLRKIVIPSHPVIKRNQTLIPPPDSNITSIIGPYLIGN